MSRFQKAKPVSAKSGGGKLDPVAPKGSYSIGSLESGSPKSRGGPIESMASRENSRISVSRGTPQGPKKFVID